MTEYEWLILLKLLVAHVVCDFFIQTDGFCEGKISAGARGWLLQVLHAFSHALVSYLCVAIWSFWQLPLLVFVSHFAMDVIKAKINKPDSIWVFAVDQTLHVGILVLICLFLIPENDLIISSSCRNGWLYVLGYSLLLKPTSVCISLFFKKWKINNDDMALPKAGRWIGYFERVLVMTFMLLGSYESIGFLMAAKSIFRFGDLKENHEIKMTEYVLLGTLMSFAIAVVIALIAKSLLRIVC